MLGRRVLCSFGARRESCFVCCTVCAFTCPLIVGSTPWPAGCLLALACLRLLVCWKALQRWAYGLPCVSGRVATRMLWPSNRQTCQRGILIEPTRTMAAKGGATCLLGGKWFAPALAQTGQAEKFCLRCICKNRLPLGRVLGGGRRAYQLPARPVINFKKHIFTRNNPMALMQRA